jgi:uncharacterized membrane protein YgdD (TMEM256/DUF423 family)
VRIAVIGSMRSARSVGTTLPTRSISLAIASTAISAQAIDGLRLQWLAVDRTFLLLGAVAAFLGVTLGAFGAHGLRGRLTPDMLAVFETAVRYHMYHALALLLVAVVMGRMSGWLIQTAGWCFVAGILLFSGSLYALALSGVTILGAITPIGGVAFLAGWACLAFAAI